ncbi:dynamin family protein [Paenibacillus sp. FSL K6-2862]|uniref:dynamin family protein n=1 Tax=Paenibacillus sp. FSL K6-2862 TaxID=2921484 RepID=UPI0030F623D3
MISIQLKYNPYTIETDITIDGEPLPNISQLYKYKRERLQVWLHELIDKLTEELNENRLDITFYGTLLDFEDISELCERYNNAKQAEIHLTHQPARETLDKISELRELAEDMLNGPFEEFKTETIRRNFEKALSSDFEIAVIATMSSGKSTLINALLGQELMPSKHAACTATIASIRNNHELQQFTGSCYDLEGKELTPVREIDLNTMREYNDNPEVAEIKIEGKIPHISDKNMNLVLLDTPGPNNSRTRAHEDHTNRVIKNEETKPMVLYVLNSTALSTTDDSHLLSTVAEQMRSGGKQSKDRFIFAVNKIDEFDPEIENVPETLNQVRDYLQEKGIENPNIYPVSAEMGKLIRMYQADAPLSRKQQMTLRDHEHFIEESQLHLVKYAPLSHSAKVRLQDRINIARQDEDSLAEALIHSGIPSIEEAINMYLDKYAVTQKIATAVNSFKDVVEGKKMEQQLQSSMAANEELRQSIYEQMVQIEEALNNGQKATLLKERLEQKKYDHRKVIRPIEGKIETKIDDFCSVFINEERVEEDRARKIVEKFSGQIASLQSDIKTDIEQVILSTIRNDTNALLAEYRYYVEGLIEESGNALVSNELQIFTAIIPNAEDIVNKFKYITEVEDTTSGGVFRKIFRFLKLAKPKYKTVHYVNIDDIANQVVYPAKMELFKAIKHAHQYLKEEEGKLKQFFYEEMDRLESVLEIKVAEIRKLAESGENIDQKLEEDQEKKMWLAQFVGRLDQLLEL